jgi:hypothetical protein
VGGEGGEGGQGRRRLRQSNALLLPSALSTRTGHCLGLRSSAAELCNRLTQACTHPRDVPTSTGNGWWPKQQGRSRFQEFTLQQALPACPAGLVAALPSYPRMGEQGHPPQPVSSGACRAGNMTEAGESEPRAVEWGGDAWFVSSFQSLS